MGHRVAIQCNHRISPNENSHYVIFIRKIKKIIQTLICLNIVIDKNDMSDCSLESYKAISLTTTITIFEL